MNEMLFEELNGGPVARLPHTFDGTPRVADGVATFNLAQAAGRFRWAEGALRELYATTFADVAGLVGQAEVDAPQPELKAHAAGVGLVDEVRSDLLRHVMYPQLQDDEYAFFMKHCAANGVNPWLKRVIPTVSKDLNGQRQIVLVTTVEQLRVIADRTERYAGQTPPEWRNADGQWVDFFAGPGFPAGARVGIHRHGFPKPVYGVVHWEELAQRDEKGVLLEHWDRMPALMIAKCAEAAALRRAFPDECGGLFVREELRSGTPKDPASKARLKDPSDDGPVVEPVYDDLPRDEQERMARQQSRRVTV